MSKQWKQLKIFETFEEADFLRQKMLEVDESGKLEIKIRRCGQRGMHFKVKSFYPAALPSTNKKSKKK